MIRWPTAWKHYFNSSTHIHTSVQMLVGSQHLILAASRSSRRHRSLRSVDKWEPCLEKGCTPFLMSVGGCVLDAVQIKNWLHLWCFCRSFLPLLQPGLAGFHLHLRLPAWDQGPPPGGDRGAVRKPALLLRRLRFGRRTPGRVHPG